MGLNLNELRRFLEEESEVSRGDVFSPGGSATFSGPARRDLTVALSPREEGIRQLGGQTRFRAANVAQQLGKTIGAGDLSSLDGLDAFDTERGFGRVRGATSDAARDRAEQSVFQRGFNFLQPQMQEETRQAREELAARGIPEDSVVGRRMLDDVSRRQGLARENLALSAVQAGGQEASRRFGDILAGEEFGVGARQQAFGEDVARQQQPVSLLGQLMSLGQYQSPIVPGQTAPSTGAGVALAQGARDQNAFDQGGIGRELLLGGLQGLAGVAGGAAQAGAFDGFFR